MSDASKYIEIQGVEQTFKTKKGNFPALRDINLTVAKGEFVTLIGHSGCGKSTLLNLIAGLTVPTNGVLLCADKEIAGPGPERAVVFQNHSLLPGSPVSRTSTSLSNACSRPPRPRRNSRSAPTPHWPWWASHPPRRNDPARFPAA